MVNVKHPRKGTSMGNINITVFMWQSNIYLFNKHLTTGPGSMCQRDVGGVTKTSKIKKLFEGLKAVFESQELFYPQLSTRTLRIVLTLIKHFSKNAI